MSITSLHEQASSLQRSLAAAQAQSRELGLQMKQQVCILLQVNGYSRIRLLCPHGDASTALTGCFSARSQWHSVQYLTGHSCCTAHAQAAQYEEQLLAARDATALVRREANSLAAAAARAEQAAAEGEAQLRTVRTGHESLVASLRQVGAPIRSAVCIRAGFLVHVGAISLRFAAAGQV